MFRNLGLKLLAIFFAVALWSVVAYASNPTESHTYSLGVSIQGLPSGLVVVGSAPQVQVTVTATADNLHAFLPADLNVLGNFDKVKIGKNQVPIRVDNSDPSVEVTAPDSVQVSIDQAASATLTVSIVRFNSLLPGYHEVPNATSVTPATVQVSGPKSKLNGIQAVVRVDLATANSPGINTPEPVTILDANKKVVLLNVNPQNVTVKMAVEADAITVTKAVGFSLIGQPAPGYRITNVQVSPLTVQATGLQNLLGQIAVLQSDPVDITGQKSDVVRTVAIRPPNGVEVSLKTATVHVYISPIPGASPTSSPTTTP